MGPDDLRTEVPDAGADAPYSPPARPSGGHALLVLPVVAAGASLAWIAFGAGLGTGERGALLVVAFSAHAATLVVARRRPVVSMRAAAVLVGVALAVAVLLPLHRSDDLFLYDMYGRMVVEHGENPYAVPPSAVAPDPIFDEVAEDWHDQRALYGPVFVGVSAPIAAAAGTSALAVRITWQLVAAAAAAAAAWSVARRTADPAAVVALGCSPVLLAAVNDAHNDVLIGLALLAAALAIERDRPVVGGFAAAAALGTKLVAAVPFLGLALWALVRRGPATAARFVGPVVGVLAAGYLLVGAGDALEVLREDSGDDSRFALWQPLRDDLFESLRAAGWSFRPTLEYTRDRVALAAAAVLVVTVLVVLWRFRRSSTPLEPALAVGLAYLLVGTYVVPWYPAALLPLAACVWRSRVAVLVWAQSAFLMLAYVDPPGRDPSSWLGLALEDGGATWVSLILVCLLVLWARPSSEAQVTSPAP